MLIIRPGRPVMPRGFAYCVAAAMTLQPLAQARSFHLPRRRRVHFVSGRQSRAALIEISTSRRILVKLSVATNGGGAADAETTAFPVW